MPFISLKKMIRRQTTTTMRDLWILLVVGCLKLPKKARSEY